MLIRILFVAGLLVIVTLAYLWWQRRQGTVRALDDGERLTPSDLAGDGPVPVLGAEATFVQFSTPLCAVCPGTARLLTSVAAERPGAAHVEVDASERLDLARRFDIMRTPTTLVIDRDGAVVARMNGAPTVDQARAALAEVPPPDDYSI